MLTTFEQPVMTDPQTTENGKTYQPGDKPRQLTEYLLAKGSARHVAVHVGYLDCEDQKCHCDRKDAIGQACYSTRGKTALRHINMLLFRSQAGR